MTYRDATGCQRWSTGSKVLSYFIVCHPADIFSPVITPRVRTIVRPCLSSRAGIGLRFIEPPNRLRPDGIIAAIRTYLFIRYYFLRAPVLLSCLERKQQLLKELSQEIMYTASVYEWQQL
jgi:hypothetical protein